MATKGTRFFTFRDIEAGKLANGLQDPDIVEMYSEENPHLKDIPWKQCNKGKEDIVTIRTGMPEAVVRAYYQGWKGSKTSKKQVANACCRVTTGLEFDWQLYADDKDKAAFLSDEQRAHMSVLGDKAAGLLFYGSTEEDPTGINGFARTFSEYGALTGSSMVLDDKLAAFYCLNGGKASEAAYNRRSIFLCGWSPKSGYGIFPEGTSAGIQVGELQKQYIRQDDGSNLLMGMQEMNQHLGLTIRDFRYFGRIGNINVMSDPSASGAVDQVKLVRKLVTRVKSSGVTQHWYTSRLAFEHLAEQFEKKTQANAIKYADLAQKMPETLFGIPVSFCDCMNGDEAEVTAKA